MIMRHGCAWLLMSLSLLAAEEETRKPTGPQVLANYVKVTGGEAAYKKVASTVSTGAVELVGMNIKGSITIHAQAPNKLATQFIMEGLGEIALGFDGKTGWSSDMMFGLRQLEGLELAQIKLASHYNLLLDWQAQFREARYGGQKDMDGYTAHVVVLVPKAEGLPPWTMYFDADSFLLTMIDKTEISIQGKIKAQVFVEDYREVEGLLLPFTMRQKSPVAEMRMVMTEIKLNAKIDPAVFAKPDPPAKAPAPPQPPQ